MNKNINVFILSQEGCFYGSEALNVNLRGVNGEMGISYGHTQLLSILPPGIVCVNNLIKKFDSFYISGGILEVQPDSVIVLSDVVERAENLDKC